MADKKAERPKTGMNFIERNSKEQNKTKWPEQYKT